MVSLSPLLATSLRKEETTTGYTILDAPLNLGDETLILLPSLNTIVSLIWQSMRKPILLKHEDERMLAFKHFHLDTLSHLSAFFVKRRWICFVLQKIRFSYGLLHFSWFHDCFISAAFLTQTICLDDTTVKFEIWDTAGQENIL